MFNLIHSLMNSCTIMRATRQINLPDKSVVLTFDDGPNQHQQTTTRLLEVLKRYQVTGYFCLIGQNVEAHPDLVQKIAAEGHFIVNHGYEDKPIILKSNAEIKADIIKCNRAIGQALGLKEYRTAYYRPPYGLYRPGSEKVWTELNMAVAPVTCYTFDAEYGPGGRQTIVSRLIRTVEAHNGGVIILHDGKDRHDRLTQQISKNVTSPYNRTWVPEAIEAMIIRLKTKGFNFTVLS